MRGLMQMGGSESVSVGRIGGVLEDLPFEVPVPPVLNWASRMLHAVQAQPPRVAEPIVTKSQQASHHSVGFCV